MSGQIDFGWTFDMANETSYFPLCKLTNNENARGPNTFLQESFIMKKSKYSFRYFRNNTLKTLKRKKCNITTRVCSCNIFNSIGRVKQCTPVSKCMFLYIGKTAWKCSLHSPTITVNVSYYFYETIVKKLPHNLFLLNHLTSLKAMLLDHPTCT